MDALLSAVPRLIAEQLAWLSHNLTPGANGARVAVAIARESAPICGRFQRAWPPASRTFQRRSGGHTYQLAPGHVYCALALAHPAALVAATPAQLLNRYVRPALAVLTGFGCKTSYFGRDWLSANGHPMASVSYAFDARSNACLVELLVGVHAPHALPGAASFMGKSPAAMADLCARAVEPEALAQALARAFVDLGAALCAVDFANNMQHAPMLEACAPWIASTVEAMGSVSAGLRLDGSIELGGEYCVAEDALRALEHAVMRLPADAAAQVQGLVDAHLGPANAALFGVRKLAAFEHVLRAAHAAHRKFVSG